MGFTCQNVASRANCSGWLLKCVATAVIAMAPGSACSQAPQEIVKLHEALDLYLGDFEVTFTANLTESVPAADAVSEAELVVLVRRKENRQLLSLKQSYSRSGAEPSFSWNDFMVYENGDVLAIQARVDGSYEQLGSVQPALGLSLTSERISGKKHARNRKDLYNLLNDASVALWVVAYMPIRDYLELDDTLTVEASSDGATVFSSSEFGDIELELSREHDWLPRRFQLSKRAHHKTHAGRLIRDEYAGTDVVEVRWLGAVDRFTRDQSGKHWAPAAMSVTRQELDSNVSAKKTIQTVINDIQTDFEPSLASVDLQSELDIPSGTPVFVVDAAHLPYRWDGNRPIPGVPEQPEDIADSLKLAADAEAEWKARWLVILASFAVIVATVCFVVLQRRRR